MATKSATRKKGADASPAPVEVKKDPGTKSGVVNPDSIHNKKRLARNDEIADRINKERYAQLGLDPETGEPVTPDAEAGSAPDQQQEQADQQQDQQQEEQQQDQQADQRTEQQADQQQQDQEQDKPEMVTLIVDGQRVERLASEVFEAGKRTLQKETAADQRLERATMLLKKAEQGLDTSASSDPGQQQKTDPSAQDDLELARRIQMGTENEAAAAIATLKSRGVDPAQLSQNVENRVLARVQYEAVKGQYKDVLEDPYLSQLAVIEDRKMVDEGDTRMPHERLPEIADKLRKWRGPQGKKVEVDLSKTAQHKAQSADTPPAASGKATVEQDEEKPPTRAEILNEMRQKRGQSPIPG